MINLNDRNWGHFKIKNIVDYIYGGKDYPKKDQWPGQMPFVGGSNTNNGITNFISKIDNTPKAIYRKVISVNRTGSVGYAFYHYYTACFQGDTRVLVKKHLTLYEALFLCTCIRQQRHQFSYGFKLGTNRLRNLKINLPMNSHKKPDWQFMNDYIEQVINKVPKSLIHNEINVPKYSLNSRPWKQFRIKDIGTIITSKDYPKKDRIPGELPYIGRTRFNNGITDYISVSSNTPKTIYKNVIAVNRNGSTGYAFYHASPAYYSGGVRVIKLDKLNRNIGLFLSTCIRQQRYQFSYGFELGKNRLNDLKINLPINSNNKPDWQFMNDYIKSMIK